jgi:hypothetical protein
MSPSLADWTGLDIFQLGSSGQNTGLYSLIDFGENKKEKYLHQNMLLPCMFWNISERLLEPVHAGLHKQSFHQCTQYAHFNDCTNRFFLRPPPLRCKIHEIRTCALGGWSHRPFEMVLFYQPPNAHVRKDL